MSVDKKKEKFENYRVNLKELKRNAKEYRMLSDLTKILSPAGDKETKTQTLQKSEKYTERKERDRKRNRQCKKRNRSDAFALQIHRRVRLGGNFRAFKLFAEKYSLYAQKSYEGNSGITVSKRQFH